jgi:hypothetical protein
MHCTTALSVVNLCIQRFHECGKQLCQQREALSSSCAALTILLSEPGAILFSTQQLQPPAQGPAEPDNAASLISHVVNWTVHDHGIIACWLPRPRHWAGLSQHCCTCVQPSQSLLPALHGSQPGIKVGGISDIVGSFSHIFEGWRASKLFHRRCRASTAARRHPTLHEESDGFCDVRPPQNIIYNVS